MMFRPPSPASQRFSGYATISQDFQERRSLESYLNLLQALKLHQEHLQKRWPSNAEMTICISERNDTLAKLTYTDFFGKKATYLSECPETVKQPKEPYDTFLQRAIKAFDAILSVGAENPPSPPDAK